MAFYDSASEVTLCIFYHLLLVKTVKTQAKYRRRGIDPISGWQGCQQILRFLKITKNLGNTGLTHLLGDLEGQF